MAVDNLANAQNKRPLTAADIAGAKVLMKEAGVSTESINAAIAPYESQLSEDQAKEAQRQAKKNEPGVFKKAVNKVFGNDTPTSKKLDMADPRVKKAKAAGYTDQQIQDYLMGRK